MDFETFDLENLTDTVNSESTVEFGYDKRKKIKSMLIDLINDGQKIIKETKKKLIVRPPPVLVRNVRRVPTGITINHKKITNCDDDAIPVIRSEIDFKCGLCKSYFKTLNLLSEHSSTCKPINLEKKNELQATTTAVTYDDHHSVEKFKNPLRGIHFKCGFCKSDLKSLNHLSAHHSIGCNMSTNLNIEKELTDENMEDDCNDMHFNDNNEDEYSEESIKEESIPQDIIENEPTKFQCSICKSDFQTLKLLFEHSDICKTNKTQASILKLKMLKKSPNKLKPILMQQTTNTKPPEQNSKQQHTIKLLKLKSGKYCCSLCMKYFENLQTGMLHLGKHYPNFKFIRAEKKNSKQATTIVSTIRNEKIIKQPKSSQMSQQIKSIVFKCSICLKEFSSYLLLTQHRLIHKQDLKCLICFKNCQSSSLLTQHQLTAHTEAHTKKSKIDLKELPKPSETSKELKKCLICFKNFQSPSLLTHHQLTAHTEAHTKKSKIDLKESQKHSETSNEIKKCVICFRNFKNSLLLTQHQIMAHRQLETRFCKICDKEFNTSLTIFNNHIINEHKSIETFPCTICEKISFTKIALDSHMLLAHMNSMVEKFYCEKCDIAPFTTEKNLHNHIIRKHNDGVKIPKTNICEICGKKLCDVSGKERHLATVHGNKHFFICEYCGKGFKNSDRSSHYRTHTDERPFHCDQCDSKFRHSNDLTVHKRLHSGQRPYKCTICHETFIASTNLNKHLKSRHVPKIISS